MTYRTGITFSDRELLELAAKSVGRTYVDPMSWEDGAGWDPLDDDGDALRLAVKLNIDVMVRGQPHEPPATAVAFNADIPRRLAVAHGDDPDAATRRAIVRAAAYIILNRAMP